MSIFLEALTDIGLGALFFSLAHDIATGLNRLAVRIYEKFPALKRLPNSRLAGTELNYKCMFYVFRAVAVLILAMGYALLGMEMLH